MANSIFDIQDEEEDLEEMEEETLPVKKDLSPEKEEGPMPGSVTPKVRRTSLRVSTDGRSAVTPLPREEDGTSRYILREYRVDKFTMIRKREHLTPSMCTKLGCNFDVAKFNGWENGWEDVPESDRKIVREALEQHVLLVHSAANDQIVSEADLPTEWLGIRKMRSQPKSMKVG